MYIILFYLMCSRNDVSECNTMVYVCVYTFFMWPLSTCLRVMAFPVLGAPRSHSDTPHSVGLLWTSLTQRPLPDKHNTCKKQTSMPPAGFELTIPASERPKTHALDRAATGIGVYTYIIKVNPVRCRSQWPRGLRRGSLAVRLLGLWVRIPPGRGCLSLVSVVCCQVEISASGWSLVQRSPTECGVSKWVWSWSPGNRESHGPKTGRKVPHEKEIRYDKSCISFHICSGNCRSIPLLVSFLRTHRGCRGNFIFAVWFSPCVFVTTVFLCAECVCQCWLERRDGIALWRELLTVSCAHLTVIDMIVTFRRIVKSQVEVIP
jgi:hypothetical protein